MRLNSRERVLTTFAHQEPDRVPAWCGASAEFWAKAKGELGLDDESLRCFFGDDFRRVFAGYCGPEFTLKAPMAVCRTVFGVEREGFGYGQPISHPLAGATVDQVHAYAWPSAEWVDTSAIRETVLAWKGEYAILGGDWSPFWHDAIDLFGMEELMVRMYTDPEAVDALFTHMVDYYYASSERIFQAADGAIDIFLSATISGARPGLCSALNSLTVSCSPIWPGWQNWAMTTG